MAASNLPEIQSNEQFQVPFQKLISRVNGLQAILVSTCEGIPLIRVLGTEFDSTLVSFSETKFSYIFAVAASQATNLKLGNLTSLVCYYENNILLHTSHGPGLPSNFNSSVTESTMSQSPGGEDGSSFSRRSDEVGFAVTNNDVVGSGLSNSHTKEFEVGDDFRNSNRPTSTNLAQYDEQKTGASSVANSQDDWPAQEEYGSIVLTLVADKNIDLGLLRKVVPLLKESLDDLAERVQTILDSDDQRQ
eukprot:g1560.t1